MPDTKVVTRHPLGKTNKPVGKENYELFEARNIIERTSSKPRRYRLK
jgi:hypothetical protein